MLRGRLWSFVSNRSAVGDCYLATALVFPAACHRRSRSHRQARGTGLAAPVPKPLHPDALARFVDPLPVPRVLEPDGLRPDPGEAGVQIPYYRVAMRPVDVQVHRDLPWTRMWGYGDAVPGPTIETRSGRGLLVEWVNELPERHIFSIDHTLCGAEKDRPDVRAVVHVHGAKVPRLRAMAFPKIWYPPGRSAVHHYPNRQDAENALVPRSRDGHRAPEPVRRALRGVHRTRRR